MSQEPEHAQMTLVDHLGELRVRLIYSVFCIFPITILCYAFSDKIFDLIRAPIQPYLPVGGLIFTAPLDLFVAHMKISLLAGVVISCPFWVYQVWMFVAPGLYTKERKYTLGFIFSGSVLFIVGVCFAYFVVYPAAFKFLLTFGGGVEKPMISVTEYLSFFITTTLIFGAAFELPLILVLLGMMGIIDQKFLKTKRRYAIVALAAVSAVITPPDLLSMLFMLIPLCILYEISVILVGIFEKKKAAEQSASEDQPL